MPTTDIENLDPATTGVTAVEERTSREFAGLDALEAPVGTWFEFIINPQGDRVRRNAQTHRALAAGHMVAGARPAVQHEGERPWPAGGAEQACPRRHVDRPAVVQSLGRGQVHDERMADRTALRGVHPGHAAGRPARMAG